MKTLHHLRIRMASMVALFAIAFATSSHAAVNAYLYFSDSTGKTTTVKINPDGSFTTPPLHAGTYRWSFAATKSTSTQAGGSDRSMSSGGDRPQESVSFNFTKIVVTYNMQSPRDAASGLPTGKRMHKPLTIMKEVDKASPKLMSDLGIIVIESNEATVSGSISGMYANGGKTSMDSWDAK